MKRHAGNLSTCYKLNKTNHSEKEMPKPEIENHWHTRSFSFSSNNVWA